jgi:predicted glutamine amidotransferase
MSGALTDLKEAMIVSSGPLNNDPYWPDVQPNTMIALDRRKATMQILINMDASLEC